MGLLTSTNGTTKKAGLLNKTVAPAPITSLPLPGVVKTGQSTPATSFDPAAKIEVPNIQYEETPVPTPPKLTGPTQISQGPVSLKDKILNKIPGGLLRDVTRGVIEAPSKFLLGDPAAREAQRGMGKEPGIVEGGLLGAETDVEKMDRLANSLVSKGIDKTRAYEIAKNDVLRNNMKDLTSSQMATEEYKRLAVTPEEEAALKSPRLVQRVNEGLVASNFLPVGGTIKNVGTMAAKIAASEDINVIKAALKETGLPPNEVEHLAPRLTKVTDPKEVENAIYDIADWGIPPEAIPEQKPNTGAGLLNKTNNVKDLEDQASMLEDVYNQGIEKYRALVKYQEGGAGAKFSEGLPEIGNRSGLNASGRRLATNSKALEFQKRGDTFIDEIMGPTTGDARDEANKFLDSFKNIIEKRKQVKEELAAIRKSTNETLRQKPVQVRLNEQPVTPTRLAEKPQGLTRTEGIRANPDTSLSAKNDVNGTYTKVSNGKEEQAIGQLAQVAKEPVSVARKVVNSLKNTKTKVLEYIQNDQERVRKLLENKDLKITDQSDPYLKSTLYSGRIGQKIEAAKEETTKAISEMSGLAKKAKVDLKKIREEVNDYLIALHAPERNMKHGNGAAGMTTEEARTLLKSIEESPRGAEIKRIAGMLRDMNNKTLDILRDSGVISDDLYEKLRTLYKNHVPLNRIFENTDDFAGALSSRGFDVKSSGIKRAKGSEREVSDILGNIVHNYEQAVLRSEKNIVDQATLAMVRDNKDVLKDIMYETKLPMLPVAKVKHKAAIDADFQDQLVSFAESLGAKFKTTGQPGRHLGLYYPASKLITRKFATPRETLSHETGHFFDYTFGLKERFYKRGASKNVAEEMIAHMERAGESANRIKNTKERFADAFEWWLTHRDLAKRDMPLFSQAMDNIIRDIPELKPILKIEPTPRFTIEQMEEQIFARQQFTNDPSILSLKENGKSVYIKIKDPNLAIALRGVGREKLGTLMNAVSSFTRFYSGLQTRFNPEFALPNKIRDLQETAIYLASQKGLGEKGALGAVGKDPQSMKDVLDALRGKDTPGAKLYKELKETGGTTGGMGLSTKKETELSLEKIEKLANSKTRRIADNLIEYIDNWNTLFEDSTRLSVYKQGLEQGMSKERAAFHAKEASINFNRMGKGGPVINALYMFSNASIQGSVKMLRALKNPKVLGTVMAAVGGSVAAINEWNDKVDPKWRDKVTKYDRLNGLPVMIPSTDENARYITIPVSWGIKPIKVMADYAYDATTNGGFNAKNMINDTLTAVLEAYNPAGGTNLLSAITPTILDTPVEIGSNISWNGNKIRPDYDKNAPRDIQYFSSLGNTTSGQAAISISELLKDKADIAISPADMKYAFDQYVGGAGRAATKTLNLGASMAGKGEKLPLDQYPFISRFLRERTPEEVGGGSLQQSQNVQDLLGNQSRDRFRLNNEARQLYKELSSIPKEEANARALEIKKENPQLFEKLKDIIEEEKLGLTYQEKQIKLLGVANGERAKYIFNEVSGMKSREEKNYYINDMRKKKIITDEVFTQLKKMVAASSTNSQ